MILFLYLTGRNKLNHNVFISNLYAEYNSGMGEHAVQENKKLEYWFLCGLRKAI